MPIEKELKSLNKQFIVNVAYSVVGEPFKQWVKDMIETRNQDMTKSKNLLINMDPDVAAAFMASTAVSSNSPSLLCFDVILKLIHLSLYSHQWCRRQPPQNWVQATKNSGRDQYGKGGSIDQGAVHSRQDCTMGCAPAKNTRARGFQCEPECSSHHPPRNDQLGRAYLTREWKHCRLQLFSAPDPIRRVDLDVRFFH